MGQLSKNGSKWLKKDGEITPSCWKNLENLYNYGDVSTSHWNCTSKSLRGAPQLMFVYKPTRLYPP
jgi:hypothetical protein